MTNKPDYRRQNIYGIMKKKREDMKLCRTGEEFMEENGKKAAAYPVRKNGGIIFRFKRFFFAAARS